MNSNINSPVGTLVDQKPSIGEIVRTVAPIIAAALLLHGGSEDQQEQAVDDSTKIISSYGLPTGFHTEQDLISAFPHVVTFDNVDDRANFEKIKGVGY